MVYYPTWWEFLILAAVVGQLLAAGQIIKSFWQRGHETMPAVAAFLMLAAAVALYAGVTWTFFSTTPELRQITVLFWCLLFGLVPMAYFTWTLANAFAVRTVDRISPFGAVIEDPSEFAAARRLALRGDIEGAVAMYRRYHTDEAHAMFEAVRLLKSVDRPREALRLCEQVAAQNVEAPSVWAEAQYQSAKLYELHLGEPAAAIATLHKVYERAPHTRYGQIAGQDLARLEALAPGQAAVKAGQAGPDPFYDSERPATSTGEGAYHHPTAADAEAPIPAEDPFIARGRQMAAAEAAGKGASARKRAAKNTAAKNARAAKAANNNSGAASGSTAASAADRGTTRKRAPKKSAAAKPAAKDSSTKNSSEKHSASRGSSSENSASKNSSSKNSASKNTAAKKSAGRKSTGKKTAGRKRASKARGGKQQAGGE